MLDTIRNRKGFQIKRTAKFKEFVLQFFSGRLIENGGLKPNMHLMVNGEEKIIKCDESIAIRLNKHLYGNMYVSVWTKKVRNEKPIYEYCDDYLRVEIYDEYRTFINSLTDMEESDEFVAIHNKLRSYINEQQFGNVAKLMRLYNHYTSEITSLKSILMITKTFKEQPEIKQLRLELKNILDDKLSRPI